jgi:hypothetical protein
MQIIGGRLHVLIGSSLMAKTPAQLNAEIAEALALNTAREISDRRIAYLISKGENVRNTPAWRDAVHEQRVINFQDPAKRKRDPRSTFTRVAITWYAIPNENKRDPRGGYLPVYEVDGKMRGDTYGRGYDKAEAEKLAEARAHEEAERYTGDWNVTVKKGRAKK